MDVQSQRTIAEAMEIRHEINQLTAGESELARAEFLSEAVNDEYFRDGLVAHDLTSRLANGILRLAETPTEQSVETSVSPELTDIADIELDEKQAELAKQRKADIEKTHDFIAVYMDTKSQISHLTSKKQQRELDLMLKRQMKARWDPEELANQPLRIRTVLESLDAAENGSHRAKQDIKDILLKQVEAHVKETALDVHPDVMAQRLIASLEPSKFEKELIDTLLVPIFKAAEFRGAQVTVDTHETLVRGVLRCADFPSVMRKGVDIARFDTDVIPKDGLYAYYYNAFPTILIDQPEIHAQKLSVTKALSQIVGFLNESVEVPEFGSINNVYSQTLDVIERMRQGDESIPDEYAKALSQKFGKLAASAAAMCVFNLGPDEYKLRTAAMSSFIEQINSGSMELFFGELSESLREGGDHMVPHTVDTILKAITAENPEYYDFLSQMYGESRSVIQDELPLYIPDPHSQLADLISSGVISSNKFEKDISNFVTDNSDEFRLPDGSFDSQGFAEYLSSENLKPHTLRLDNGFVVDIPGYLISENPTQEELENIVLLVGEDKINAVIDGIKSSTGLRRKFETIGNPEHHIVVIVRPESEQDKKEYHPIDDYLGTDYEYAEDELTFKQSIEESRRNIQQNRRRFLNDRGIMFVDKDDIGEVSIVIKKHERNPQAFVVTVDYSDEDNKLKQAKILMDSNLNFQLANKRVRSNINLLALNVITASMLEYFATQEAVETTEGTISEGSSVVARIAHLRLLPEGQNFGYDQWIKCLEVEGEDLEVLSKQQAEKYGVKRNSTYVSAVEAKDPNLGPIQIIESDN